MQLTLLHQVQSISTDVLAAQLIGRAMENSRKLSDWGVVIQMAAPRFLFLKVLKRRSSRDDLPVPKLLRRQIHRAEPGRSGPAHVIRIRQGKGGKEREVPLSPNTVHLTILIRVETSMRRVCCRFRGRKL